jgi:hypothetical protein
MLKISESNYSDKHINMNVIYQHIFRQLYGMEDLDTSVKVAYQYS